MDRKAGAASRATEVRRKPDQRRVRITWADGHFGEYDYAYLRGWCPCAVCQGHGGERHFVQTRDPLLASINTVGNYALSFAWADGHDAGIYSYRYLREICPCPECSAARVTDTRP
jgi:DUF971 family protein